MGLTSSGPSGPPRAAAAVATKAALGLEVTQGRELLFSLSASHLWITFDHMLDPEVNDWQTLGAEVDPGIYDSFS